MGNSNSAETRAATAPQPPAECPMHKEQKGQIPANANVNASIPSECPMHQNQTNAAPTQYPSECPMHQEGKSDNTLMDEVDPRNMVIRR